MNIKKKLLAAVLALAMTAQPMTALAEDVEIWQAMSLSDLMNTQTEQLEAESAEEASEPDAAPCGEVEEIFELDSYVNPLYGDTELEPAQEVLDLDTAVNSQNFEDEDYYDIDDIAVVSGIVRDAMKQRLATVSFNYCIPDYSSSKFTQQHRAIFEEAVAHTGDPFEGDTLRWQYAGYHVSLSGVSYDGTGYFTLTFSLTYYTTLAQEQAVTQKIAEVRSSLNLSGKTEYEKTRAIYDYITGHVTYDYANLSNGAYKLKYTTYAALINGTSVCQGYSLLFYRLALEEGLDARVVSGLGNGGPHGWNIVRIGSRYYNLDATWDAGRNPYDYFLLNNSSFVKHTRGAEFTTEAFNTLYPMSAVNYSAGVSQGVTPSPTETPDVTATPTGTPPGTPLPTGSTPDPTGTVPQPTGSTPNPTGTVPQPTGSIPNPTGTMPQPTGSTPNPTGTMPQPTGSTPNPTGTMPQPTGSTPNPTGAPGASVNPTPAPGTNPVTIPMPEPGKKMNIKLYPDAFTLSYTSVQYDGYTKTPEVAVNRLVKDVDYTVAYSKNINAGTAKVTIKGKGSYSGAVTKTFTIQKLNLESLNLQTWFDEYTYTGKAIKPVVLSGDGHAIAAKAYTAKFVNNVNVGTATMSLTGKGNYFGTVALNFTIVPKNLSDSDVTAVVAKVPAFNGAAVCPKVNVKAVKKALKEGIDCDFAYSGNEDAGAAEVTVTGKGNFCGSLTKSFVIPKGKNVIAAKPAVVTAEQVQAGVDLKALMMVSDKSGHISFTSGNALLTVTLEGVATMSNALPGKYPVTITGGSDDYTTVLKTVVLTVQ